MLNISEILLSNMEKEESQFKEEDNKIDVNSLLHSNISKNTVSMSFETIIDKFNNFDFVLPKYQRKYVWGPEQISNLALSIIKNIPIPPIYVYFNQQDNKYVILDGQQRVISLFLYFYNLTIKRTNNGNKTLVDFYEILKDGKNKNTLVEVLNTTDKYKVNNTKYTITENEQEIDITYADLSPESRRLIGSKYIDVVFLDIKSDEKEKVYSNIFKLLNSAGTPLKPQEIRNGIFQSEFYDMLHEVNENEEWRKLYGEKHENSRDIELLLRFLAIDYFTKYDNYNQKVEFESGTYKGSIQALLDDYSQRSFDFDYNTIDNYKNNLIDFFKKFNIDKTSFINRKNKSINHLLLESLYVAFIKSGKNIDKFSEDKLLNIIDNKEYKSAIEKSTSSKKYIEKRLTLVYKEFNCDRDQEN